MSDHIPEEIVLVILSKLNVPSLIQSRAVCRRWRSLIDSNTAVNRLHTHCLVGYFLEDQISNFEYPNFVKATAIGLWSDSKGSLTVCTNDHYPGFWLFNFVDSSNADAVLQYGPWFFGGKPIFLRRWRPCLNYVKDNFKSVPFWVKFYGIPVECWTVEVWRSLARAVGKMLPVHSGVPEPSRVQFGRMCVEVSAKQRPATSFFLRLDGGIVYPVTAEYGWTPLRCERCRVFGHELKDCALSSVYGENKGMVGEGEGCLGSQKEK